MPGPSTSDQLVPGGRGPFGSWPSPISAQLVAAGGTKLEGLAVRSDEIWWLELRPAEEGRAVLVRAEIGPSPDAVEEIEGPGTLPVAIDQLPPPWSARSRVHEYGGGAWWLGRRATYFIEATDQRIYRLRAEAVEVPRGPEPLTPEPTVPAGWRYADGQEHPDESVLVCVREDHHIGDPADAGNTQPTNEIVVLPSSGGTPQALVSGPDFVSTPRISPDGRWLSWIQWNHPNMPWNHTALMVAPLFNGRKRSKPTPDEELIRIGNPRTVADQAGIVGAGWSSDGRLIYSSDQSGFWNLHWWSEGTGGQLTHLTEGEIGEAAWAFGNQRWAELPDGRLVAVVTTAGVDSLAAVDPSGSLRPVDGFDGAHRFEPKTPVSIGAPVATGTRENPAVVVIAASPTELQHVVSVDVVDGRHRVIRPPDPVDVDPGWLSAPDAVWFDSKGRRTQAFFYPPAAAPGMAADSGRANHGEDSGADRPTGKPPLIVMGHGGPTAHNDPSLNLKIQYWTSRGFAVVDVNYGGSTGFGKEYRDRLHLAWGIVDVEDCINAAGHLADTGLVDGDRLALRGSSSGGLTVMTALIESDDFAAGTSLYGVADLTSMVADTHKFESRYFDWLVGPYPEEAERYQQRSPLSRADRISTPMLILQGTEDTVVPPSQSEAIVAALTGNGIPHLYVAFEGEPHGFRQAQSVVRSLELELWFYGQAFGFVPADEIDAPDTAVDIGPADP